jgi:gliding motility-associated-like protein
VLLHSGAVGSHAWVYVGGHPQCPDSVAFTGTILGRTSATLTYGGAVLLQWCQGDPPVSADRLQPAGGRFLADPGLHLSDDSLGTLVPALSLPRTYQLRYIPPQACADTAAVTVTILRAPTARIDLPAQACEGLPLQLDAVTLDAVAWVWMHNGLPAGGNPVLHLPDPDTGIPAGQEGDTLILTATTGQGCTAADTLRLHLSPRPDVQAIVAPKAVLEGMLPTYTAAASMDSAAIHWRLDVLPAMGEPYPLTAASAYAPTAGQAVPVEPYAMLPDHRTRAGERLRLILTATAQACTGEPDTTYTEVLQGTSPIFIPQAMTPDGNGINDVWEIRWTDSADPADYHIELFNRAGGKVLDMQPLNSHWDGGGLPDGVYWWVLKDRAGRDITGDGLTIRRK